MRKKTVAVSDDHPHVLNSLSAIFSQQDAYELLYKSNAGKDLLARLSEAPTDIAITDFASDHNEAMLDGFSKIKMLHAEAPRVKLILLTSQRNSAILSKTLDYGVDAIVSKADSVEEIIRACDHVMKYNEKFLSSSAYEILRPKDYFLKKSPVLTPRELEVIRLFSSGYTLASIADRQNRSISTISTQKYNAMRRLGISTNTDLIRYAYENGLI
ncbi:response regulator [Serratia sp. T13T92]|uniref:response regulator n=1 Tax=Serratia sp. T13T92 TaxID=3397496 RepID=UPI0039DF8015